MNEIRNAEREMSFSFISIPINEVKKINKKLNKLSGLIIAEGNDKNKVNWQIDLKSIHGLLGAIKNGVELMTVTAIDFDEEDKEEIARTITKYKIWI